MANVALIARLGINCIFAIATANGATFSRLTVKDKRAVSFNIIAKWAAICPLEIYRCKLQKHTVILHNSFLSCKYRSRNQQVAESTKNAIFLKRNSFCSYLGVGFGQEAC